ncbi:HEL082Cp [Eremothecium sinecaudum]|uniref:General transcription and DNA repair factor IIH n=1 Tax=Eremothecium sinecaudum TaxID=45286 RepID=A0A109V020_9SACH|nr:HEL082Cp [Eremothecium sinecaudum]AMD21198.1 HEL082Cp [Eremothecium sinecaudum]
MNSDFEDEIITSAFTKRSRERQAANNLSSTKRKKHVRIENDYDDEGQNHDEDEDFGGRDQSDDHASNRKKKKKLNKNLQGVNGGYAWEDDIQRSWDLVKVDDEGNMAALVASIIEARKKRAAKKDITPYQRGIIRTLILVIDCSEAMTERDLRPNRYAMTIQYAIDFVHDFFDQNPISQIGIVVMRNGVAHLASQVSGNPQEHIEALKMIRKQEPKGNPSLQNALEMARGLLLHVPSHCTREILIVFGALSTTDPGDIHQTIASLAQERIRTRVIGLSAQVAICKELCKETNYGDNSYYGVILNETHFKDLFTVAVTPLPVNKLNKGYTLIKMGFPTRIFEDTLSFCTCHSKLVYGGYFCPNCKSKVCSLPTVCPCCDLMLILSTHLARSYHHLMPLKIFQEVPVAVQFPTQNCFSCQKKFSTLRNHKTQELLTSSRYRCEECSRDFCIDCDVFIHEILHNCPGCESKATI